MKGVTVQQILAITVGGLFCLLLCTVSARFVKKASQPHFAPLPLDKQLLRAAYHITPTDSIKHILEKAREQYKDDKGAFYKFIMTQDDSDWTVLINYVVDGDVKHVTYILDTVADFFKDDPTLFAKFISHHDEKGRTALLLAMKQKHFDIVKILVSKAEEVFGHDRRRFLRFINKRHHESGKTVLLSAAYYDWQDILEFLVETAARVFGCNSSYFNRFINAYDNTGRTPLTYGNYPIVDFLKRYGGQGEEFTGELY